MKTTTIDFGSPTFVPENPVARSSRFGTFVVLFRVLVPLLLKGDMGVSIDTGINVIATAYLRRDEKTQTWSAPVTFPGLGRNPILETSDPTLAQRFADHVDTAVAIWPALPDLRKRAMSVYKAGPVAKAKADGTKANLVWSDDDTDPTVNATAKANKAEILASVPAKAAPVAKI